MNLCSVLSQQGKHSDALIYAIGAVELLHEIMNEEIQNIRIQQH